ncbi:MAG: cysteine desulfurase family protein [Phycisphaerales bacterium]
MPPLYFDHNSTTAPAPEVVDAMVEMLRTTWANPSSVHRFGQDARRRVELARESVARLIQAKPAEIIFTSGGTEADNLAIYGVVRRRTDRRTIITTRIEHSAIREPLEALAAAGFTVLHAPLDENGVADTEGFRAVVAEHASDVSLVTIQWANNETGVIQPVESLARICREVDPKIVFHTDATQWVGKMPTDVTEAPIDLLTLSGHKFHGPKGAAALFVRRGVRLAAQHVGGPQERQRRGGTENTAGVVGLGVAAELARERIARGEAAACIQALRDHFEARILEAFPDCRVNSREARFGRLWNTSNIGFPRLEAEAILLLLSERGLYASAGSACSSGSLEPSPILRALGVPDEYAHGSVRFSFSHETTADEVEKGFELVASVIERLRKATPVADK